MFKKYVTTKVSTRTMVCLQTRVHVFYLRRSQRRPLNRGFTALSIALIRIFKQITTTTSTTAGRSKEAQKWHSAHALKWAFAVVPNPTFFTVDGFKTYQRLFFSLSRKHSRLLALQLIHFPCVSQFKISILNRVCHDNRNWTTRKKLMLDENHQYNSNC